MTISAAHASGDTEQGGSQDERPALDAKHPQIGTQVHVEHPKTIAGAGQTITPDLTGRLDESTLHLGGRFAAVTWPNVDFVVIHPFNELVAA